MMLPHSIPLPDDLPWRTEGLFSPHYLQHRLPNPNSPAWPSEAEAEAVFEFAQSRFSQYHAALQTATEEDNESKWIVPLCERLGFGWNPRKAIPGIPAKMLPDFLLYASPALAETAFQTKLFYPDCLALLEAKKWNVNLSREGSKSKERSPQLQIRDYLGNTTSQSWGVLTNGGKWRLTCKHDRASAFFEFDLERVMQAALLPETQAQARQEFRLFYALFRRAAFERGPDGLCLLDGVRAEARLFQAEVERRLRVQVFDCVEILARGFLENPENALSADDLPEIYGSCLILLYRILFVLNAEARALLPTAPRDTPSGKYYNSYGLEFVRQKLAAASGTEYDDDQTWTLDARLRGLFSLINGKPGLPGKDKNVELGIPRYNGGLFDPSRYPFLEKKHVADSFLAEALRRLAYRTDGSEQIAFDYANLGERHLGSIYEGLLEHRLTLVAEGNRGEPRGTEGNRGEPRGTEGNRGEPRGTEGNRGEPRGTEGNRGEPRGTEGNRGEPRGTEGNRGEPRGTYYASQTTKESAKLRARITRPKPGFRTSCAEPCSRSSMRFPLQKTPTRLPTPSCG